MLPEHCQFCKRNISQDKGSLLEGDRPLRILKLRRKDQKLFVKVEWAVRGNGFNPRPSWLSTAQLRDPAYQLLLLEFYESLVRWVPTRAAPA